MKMSARVMVRVPQDLKANLEQAAAKEGKPLADYLRDHLPDIAKAQGVEIGWETASTVATPGHITFAPKEIDPLDDYIITMKKMAVAKMFQQFAFSPAISPEQGIYYGQRLKEPSGIEGKKDEISMEDIMKYNTIMTQMLTQAELARRSGRPEDQQLSNKFMEQYMALSQQQQTMTNQFLQQQSALFQTALNVRQAGEQKAQESVDALRSDLEKTRGQVIQAQMQSQQQFNELQMKNLEDKLEEIRSAPSELEQITKLSKMAETDPAIRAFMNKRLGIEEKKTDIAETLEKLSKGKVGDLIDAGLEWLRGQRRVPSEAVSPPPPVPPPLSAQEQQAAAEVVTRLSLEEGSSQPPPPPPSKPKPSKAPPPTKPEGA